jgi:hypothetical protein
MPSCPFELLLNNRKQKLLRPFFSPRDCDEKDRSYVAGQGLLRLLKIKFWPSAGLP